MQKNGRLGFYLTWVRQIVRTDCLLMSFANKVQPALQPRAEWSEAEWHPGLMGCIWKRPDRAKAVIQRLCLNAFGLTARSLLHTIKPRALPWAEAQAALSGRTSPQQTVRTHKSSANSQGAQVLSKQSWRTNHQQAVMAHKSSASSQCAQIISKQSWQNNHVNSSNSR